ncbi:glycoside hydrolase superfamily [Mycotypha africana]|uniref:glycoside hydrolase superfamily n=1 Tax=Mycotypha africana TaxID=64632 RepID=UPI0022FFEF4D|nr:glycoside hydrolase superfamily [Mycotypha africana]KAI8991663.1 glycoside hydrolase superfamily [Mycotypha africana]
MIYPIVSVSPVWFYIERRASMQFDILGEHDVDQGWMKETRDQVKSKGKILPRFQCRGWTSEDLQTFISSKAESFALASMIHQQVQKHKFDGVVIECGFPAFFPLLLSRLSQLLHHHGQQLIVVLPAIMTEEHKKYMQPDFLHAMAQYVDRFSLMSYDFSSHNPNGGPSAPIEWIMDNTEFITSLLGTENKHKLLVGLNMYAMSYLQTRAPEALVLRTVVEHLSERQGHRSNDEDVHHHHHLLTDDEDLNWDKESQEAWFIDMDEGGSRRGTVWLPTLRSIKNRVRFAEDYGVGLALWEVGQGLDYFYNLF